MVNQVFSGQTTTKTQISESIEKIRTAEMPDIQKEAFGQIDKLTRKIKTKDLDDEILNDLVELIDVSEAYFLIQQIFENLEPHAKNIAPTLLPLLITKVRTGRTPNIRNLALEQIVPLVRSIKPKNIDDKILNDFIELLDIPDARFWVAQIIGLFGSRAKSTIPKLRQLLIIEECSYVDSLLYPKFSAADGIRVALTQLGIDPPPRFFVDADYCANQGLLKARMPGEMYENCNVNNCID